MAHASSVLVFARLTDYCKRFPVGMYLFRVNNGNTRTICEICSNLTINTLSLLLILKKFYTLFHCFRCWPHWRRSGVFIVNFEQISHISLVFPLLTLNRQMPACIEISPEMPLKIKFPNKVCNIYPCVL